MHRRMRVEKWLVRTSPVYMRLFYLLVGKLLFGYSNFTVYHVYEGILLLYVGELHGELLVKVRHAAFAGNIY